MKSNLLTDFSVDKQHNKIYVKREFAAPLATVWKAWTVAEILDKWWAPLPYKNKTKSMDFSEGGTWLYSMTGPEGDTHWCRADYQKIDSEKNFSDIDAFCDENGNITNDFPRTQWLTEFSESGDTTLVNITLTYDKLADLEKIMEMGFKEGFTTGMDQLEAWLYNN
jgi:uncharacterized protein YndB with AHSA1/START domain